MRRLVLVLMVAALTVLMVAVATAGAGVAQVKKAPPKEDAKYTACEKSDAPVCPN